MLWGLSGDPPFDSVRRHLAAWNVPLVAVDQRTVRRTQFDLNTHGAITGRVTVCGEPTDLDDIGALYVRPYDVRQVLSESRDTAQGTEDEATALMLGYKLYAWAEITDARVVNRPSAASSNCSKPHQAELIRRSGFDTPDTIVTTSPDRVREFVAQHEQVIYKSVSDARSMVTRIDESQLSDIDDVVHCPTQFQSYVAGTDWRVHVVGDDVFACEIHCAADDYRCAEQNGAPLDIHAAALPAAVAARCHALATDLNLTLAGIDLRRTSDDAWYCFEVNPSPAFTYYEEAAGQPIGESLARLLSGPCADATQGGA